MVIWNLQEPSIFMNLEFIKVIWAGDRFEDVVIELVNCSHKNKGDHPVQVFK